MFTHSKKRTITQIFIKKIQNKLRDFEITNKKHVKTDLLTATVVHEISLIGFIHSFIIYLCLACMNECIGHQANWLIADTLNGAHVKLAFVKKVLIFNCIQTASKYASLFQDITLFLSPCFSLYKIDIKLL